MLLVSTSSVLHALVELKEQVDTLFRAVWEVRASMVPALFQGAAGNVVRRVYRDWKRTLATYVNDKPCKL